MRHKEIFGLVVSGKSLLEAPQTIGGTDFDMSDDNTRYQYTRHLLNLSPKMLEDTQNYELYHCIDRDHECYFALEKPHGTLIYFVKCETSHFGFVGPAVTQVAVWRDIKSSASYGIGDHLFFDVLLGIYPTVMSDEQQTSRGRDFWIIRMAKAPQLGFRIGLADTKTKTVEWKDETTLAAKWIQDHESAWSTDPASRNIRFIVSK